MLELLLQTGAYQIPQADPASGVDWIEALGGAGLSIGFVYALKEIGVRAAMGYFLPDTVSDEALDNARTTRNVYAVAVLALAYLTGVALTTTAVYLTTTLAFALAWAGLWAFIASVVALAAARKARPVDHVRLLAETRRRGDE